MHHDIQDFFPEKPKKEKYKLNLNFSFFKKTSIVALTAAQFLCQGLLYSDSATWNGSTDDSWGTLANWGPPPGAPLAVPGAGNTAFFSGTDDNGTIVIDGPRTLDILSITAGNYTFQEGTGGLSATTITISSTGTITFDTGAIDSGATTRSSTGNLVIAGGNTLLSLAHTGTGTITLNGSSNTGALTCTGGGTISLGGGTTTAATFSVANGTLTGTGTIAGAVTIAGTISPAGAATTGTIAVTGTFTLDTGGAYLINISPTASDVIAVTGAVDLSANNSATLNVLAGTYQRGDTYNVITSGGLTGNITTFTETHPFDWDLVPQGNNLVLIARRNVISAPSTLVTNGNANDFAITNFVNSWDAENPTTFAIATLLLSDPTSAPFLDKARRMAPFQNGLNRFIRLVNSLAALDNSRGRQQLTFCNDCDAQKNEGFFSPIFVYSHANELNEQKGYMPGFDNYAEGFTFGYQRRIFEKGLERSDWIAEATGGLSYIHSKAFFYDNRGTANQNNFYATASGSFRNPSIATALQVTAQYEGGGNKVSRVVTLQRDLGNSNQIASSRSWSNAILFGCDAMLGPKYPIYRNSAETNALIIAPQAGVYTYFLWSGKFQESGAGNFNLRGQSEQATWLVPQAKLNVVHEINNQRVCFKPGVHVGWIGYYPLRANNITSGLFNLDNNTTIFTINVNPHDNRYINQLTAGVNIALSQCEQFMFELKSEVRLFDDVTSVDTKARLQINF